MSLILFDRLTPEQQQALSGLEKDPDLYGILYPLTGAVHGIKSVGRDTALLYYTMQQPGPLPSYVKALAGERFGKAIAQLILDGVLEIQRDGSFVSGPAAYNVLYEEEQLRPPKGELQAFL